jgi:membrane protease YdiL (CAAX protease family)
MGILPWPIWDHELDDVYHMVANELLYWSLVGATLLYVRLVERESLATLALRRPGLREFPIAVLAAVLTLAGFWVISQVLLPALHLEVGSTLERLQAAPTWWLVASSIRAGVSEEILFRGYPIPRLEAWTGSRAVALLLPLLVFTVAHVGPWNWTHALFAAFGGAVFTVLYVWRRNLWTNMLAHALVDLVAILG